MTFRSILDDAVATLRRSPHVALESTMVLPGQTPESLKEIEDRTGIRLAPWVEQLYTQIGGVHISWRLSPAGYDKLEPGRTDNKHRYDVSGNLDILSLEEASNGFAGQAWKPPYGERAKNYRPLDFSSLFVNLGFSPEAPRETDGLVLFILYNDQRVPLGMTLTEYLQLGAELLFMNEWQRSLLSDEESVKHAGYLRGMKDRLAKLPAD